MKSIYYVNSSALPVVRSWLINELIFLGKNYFIVRYLFGGYEIKSTNAQSLQSRSQLFYCEAFIWRLRNQINKCTKSSIAEPTILLRGIYLEVTKSNQQMHKVFNRGANYFIARHLFGGYEIKSTNAQNLQSRSQLFYCEAFIWRLRNQINKCTKSSIAEPTILLRGIYLEVTKSNQQMHKVFNRGANFKRRIRR